MYKNPNKISKKNMGTMVCLKLPKLFVETIMNADFKGGVRDKLKGYLALEASLPQ